MLKKRLKSKLESLFLYIFRNEINRQEEILNKIEDYNNKVTTNLFDLKRENELLKTKVEDLCTQIDYLKVSNIKCDGKKVLIAGFYGAPNCGDEYMLETILDYLSKYNNIDITVLLANNSNYKINNKYNVKYIHYPYSNIDCNIYAQSYDLLIWGGGAIIDDSNYLDSNSYKYSLGSMILDLSENFIVFKKNVIFLGVSSSHVLNNKEYIDRLNKVIDNSYFVSIRDNNSFEYLSKILNTKNMTLSEDIVLSNKQIIPFIRKRNKNDVKEIGIIWINDKDTEEELLKVIKAYKRKYNDSKISLIPFYDYFKQDILFYEHFIEKYKLKDVVITRFPKTIMDFIEITKNIDYIISLRYHGTLLANVLNIPNLSICYDKNKHYRYKIAHINELFKNKNVIDLSSIKDNSLNKYTDYYNDDNYIDNVKIVERESKKMSNTIKSIIVGDKNE